MVNHNFSQICSHLMVLVVTLMFLLTGANEATYSIEFGSNFSLR